MSSPFVKVYGSIVRSSIWLEPHHVLRLFLYMLVEADKDGFVEGSKLGIAGAARLAREETDDAFARLEAPDPDSKSEELEGRRIVKVENGWVVVNKAKYRDLRTPEQVATAERVARHRARQREEEGVTGNAGNVHETLVTPPSTSTSGGSGESVNQEEPTTRDAVQADSAILDEVWVFCTRLAVAANTGLGQAIPRILASNGWTRRAAEEIHRHGIPVEFAERIVLASAQELPAVMRADIKSLTYFTPAVLRAWEQKQMADDVARSPLGKKTAPTKLGDVVAAIVPEERPDVRLCPLCERMLVEPDWAAHFARKHLDTPVPPFTDALKP